MEFVTIKEICTTYDISVPTFRKYRHEYLPQLTRYRKRYSSEEIEAFMRSYGINKRIVETEGAINV